MEQQVKQFEAMPLKLRALVLLSLLALNLIVFNVLIRPSGVRLDLTEGREYTISETTVDIVRAIPDEVHLYGYFSEKTHEKLAPLVPKIKDLLEEYRVRGRGKVIVHVADPRESEDLEKEAHQRFGVRPTPFRIQSKWEAGIQSSYFQVVIAYGDQHEMLEVGDMVEVSLGGSGEPIVSLRNLEYQITSAMQKVVRAFGSLESRLAELPEPIEVQAFITSPDSVGDAPPDIKKFLAEKKVVVDELIEKLAERFPAGVRTSIGDPSSDPKAKVEVQRYRIRPVRASLFDQTLLYVALAVRYQQQAEVIPLYSDEEIAAADLMRDVEGTIKRLLPGALKRVGIVSAKPDIPPQQLLQMQMQGMEPPGDEFKTLRRSLAQGYDVADVKLESGRPPLDVDALLVLRPKDLSEKARFALDQYVMLGGRAIVFQDKTELDQESRMGLRLKDISSGLEPLFEHYGVTQEKVLCLDERNLTFPLRVPRDLGGFRIEEVREVPYPWFLDVRGESIDRENPVVGAVDRLGLLWASPFVLDEAKQPAARYTRLVRSSEKAWTAAEMADVSPQNGSRLEPGYTVPEKTAERLLAVAIEGRLTSAWKGKPAPFAAKDAEDAAKDAEDAAKDAEDAAKNDETEKDADTEKDEASDKKAEKPSMEPVEESGDNTRFVLVGDADLVSDIGAQVLSQGGTYQQNLQFVTNLIDWTLLDEALIRIRSRGGRDRPLATLTPTTMLAIEIVNYIIPAALIVLFGMVRFTKRRKAARRTRPTSITTPASPSPAETPAKPIAEQASVPATAPEANAAAKQPEEVNA